MRIALLLLSTTVAIAVSPARAGAEPERSDTETQHRAGWRLRMRGQVRSEYSDNVFFLSPVSIARQHLATDPPSRYRDMNTYADLALIPGLRAELRGPSPLGRQLRLSAEVAYAIYMQNAAKNFPEVTVRARQDAGKRGRVFIVVDDQIGFFYNNAVVGGQDVNGNGSINSAEREYASIVYDELVASAGYERVLRPMTGDRSLAVEATASAGYYRRAFRGPLANRLENAPLVSAGVGIAHRSSARLDLAYTYMAVANAPHAEFVMLDETAWGMDLSQPADGSASATHAGTTQFVDRSYRMHKLGAVAGLVPWHPLELAVSYELRLKSFGSDDIHDVGHFDRRDLRHDVELAATHRFSPRWRIELGYRYTTQTTRRAPAPGMLLEREQYTINRVSAELSATF